MWYKFSVILLLLVNIVVQVTSLNEVLRGQSILYGISSLAGELNNSSKCFRYLTSLFESVDAKRVWAIKAMDASGRPDSGFLYGNNLWIGSHAQCSDISNTRRLEVSYIQNKHADETPYDYPPFPMEFVMAYMKHNNTLQHHTQLPLEFTIQLGLCLPRGCTTEELSYLLEVYFSKNFLEMQKLYDLHLNVIEIKALAQDGLWMFQLPKTIILLILVGIVIVLTIVGTVYDVKKHNREKNIIFAQTMKNGTKSTSSELELVTSSNMSLSTKPTIFGEIVKCFSIYSNVKALVKTKLPEDSVKSIHGLRFFGMLWVIMVHTIFYQTDYLKNAALGYRLSEDIFAQTLSNSTYCVDTYLFLSGFLVSYLFFKSRKEDDDDKNSVSYLAKVNQFVMMCLNRFLRLTPPYVFVILLTDVMYTYYRKTSSLTSSEYADELCSKYWWRNILYINNLWPRSEMCLSWSWYLSVDTQFFAITVFLLILSTMAFKTSAALAVMLIIVNITATAYKSYSIGYIPTMDEQLNKLDAIYDLPWNRIGPYLIGAITGYILIVKLKRQLPLKERTRVILWTLFPLLNLWILFTLYTRELSVEFSAIYMGISRTLWGVGIAWVLVACCTGNARALEKFLSFRGFVPFSRVTYMAYLLNPLMANMLFLGSESSLNSSIADFSMTVGGVTLFTFYLAFVFSILFESPFILLTKMMFVKLKRKEVPEPTNQAQSA